ncbi:MAG: twin-arginine translocase TatA/TatE family subunit [Bdellovibrionota bacterium]
MNLGMTEMLLIAGIALLFFGPSRLPGLGKSVGQAIRSFKKGITEDSPDDGDAEKSKHSQLSHDSATPSSSGQKQPETEKNRLS